MKKFLKRSMCVFLSVLMAATTLVAIPFTASATSGGSAPADLLSAIQGYESKMAENKIYTNMSAAYEAYVTACNWYDKYVLGTDGYDDVVDVSTAAAQLVTETENMKEVSARGDYNPDLNYATGAADGSYIASELAEYNDSQQGVIYAYGVGSSSGYSYMDDVISSNRAMTSGLQFGTVAILYTDEQAENGGYTFPINFLAKRKSSTATLRYYFVNIASGGTGDGSIGSTGNSYTSSGTTYPAVVCTMNDDVFSVSTSWHGAGTNTVGYQKSTSAIIPYYGTSSNTGSGSSGTSDWYYSNTVHYTGKPDEDEYVKKYGYLDFETATYEQSRYNGFTFASPEGTYATDGNGGYVNNTATQASILSSDTINTSDENIAYGVYTWSDGSVQRTQKMNKNNTEGDAAQAIYIVNWQALLDAMNEYAGTTSPLVEVYNYREGGLSEYMEALDNLTRINPTLSNSSDPNGWASNEYYIDSSSTSAGVADKVTAIENAMNTYIPQLKDAYQNTAEKKDSETYNPLRDDSTFVHGWARQVDENGQSIYGIADLQTTVYEYGQYRRDDTGNVTNEKVYDDDSWAIFTEAYKLAQAVMRYGAENGYKNDYPISNYGTLSYNGVLLDGVDITNYTYDDIYLEEYTEDSTLGCSEEGAYTLGETYYKLVYDANSDGTLTVDEVCAALSRAYENLQYHFILNVVDADILYEVIKEAERLIQSSSYFTDQSFTDANLETLISLAKIAVWGAEENYGIKAELLEESEKNQQIVDDEVSALVSGANNSGVEGLYIDWQKTVSSAGGYSLSSITALCNGLDESIYTTGSWAALQALLAEKDLYLAGSSETYGGRNVTIDTSSATAVAGSAYKYIENYIALVRDIYYAYLSLEKSFTSIENGEIANVGETVTATTYTNGNNETRYWRLNMEYQQGLIFFRTTSDEYLFDLQNPQFSWQSKADHDALLDSISLDAQNDYAYFEPTTDASGNTTYAYGLDESDGYGTYHELNHKHGSAWSNASGYGIDADVCAQYPGNLTVETDNGTFEMKGIFITNMTAAADYYGYEPYLDSDTGERIPVTSMTYDWTNALLTTEGNDDTSARGGQGPLGGILTHSSDNSNSWGETDFTATYTYTMPEYEKEDLSAATRPTITTEDHEYGLGIVDYERTTDGLFDSDDYREYWMGASAYNPKVTVIDITYLFDLIDLAESLRESDYTTASWEEFETAYNAAVAYMSYSSMSAAEIYSACCTRYDDLWAAYEKLVPVATLNVIDCTTGATINSSDYEYEYTKDDTANQVTISIETVPYNYYIDEDTTYTVAQGGVFTITVHTDCEVETTTLPAQCSVDGYRDTSTHCNVCNKDVGYSRDVLEMTGDHEMSDWEYAIYATDEHAGLKERHCTNEWDGAAYGTTSDGCNYYETEVVEQKKDPILEVDKTEVENTDDGGIYYAYPTEIGVDENLNNDNQYVIEFEYTGDAADVLNWVLEFTDENGGTYLEGRDYTIYYTSGGPYKERTDVDNSHQTYCTVSFRSAKAQEAWDEGTLIVNANTAIFKLGITAVDCLGNTLDDVTYTVTNGSGGEISFTGGTYSGVADTYTVTVTDANGYTLDEDASVLETTIGDRDYDDLLLVFHTDMQPGTPEPTEPTCTEAGFVETVYTCQNCEDYYYVETEEGEPATGHDYQVSEEDSLPATCTEDGYNRYICSRCDSSYDEVLSATGHVWVEDENQYEPPSCSTEGSAHYTCSNCGEEKTVTISATSHEYVAQTPVAPTCTEPGYTEYICSKCNDTFYSYTPAAGHMWRINSEESYAATCTTPGLTVYDCTKCTETKEVDIDIDENAHNYQLVEKQEPSCTKDPVTGEPIVVDGYYYYECTYNSAHNYTEYVSGDAAHVYDETSYVYTAPDCETPGELVLTCNNCGTVTTYEIPALGHDYEKTCAIEAGCETPEYTVYACTNCVSTITASLENGEVKVTATAEDGCTLYDPQYEDDEWVDGTGSYVYFVTAEATGHAYRYDKDLSTPANCGEAGTDVYTCANNCGSTYTIEVEPTGDHTWNEGEVTVKATCYQEGEILYTCTTCGATYTETVPNAHTWPEDDDDDHIIVTPATCVDGSIEYHCTECNEIITTEVIPATGHSYEKLVVDPLCEEDGYTIYYCKYCVDKNSVESAVDTTTNVFSEDEVEPNTGYTFDITTDDEGNTVNNSYYTGDTVASTGHNYQYNEEASSEASCTEDGYNRYICENNGCNKYYDEVLSATGHVWVEDEGEESHKDQTCVAAGYTKYTCSNCGETKTEPIPADGTSHTWSIAQEPTCTEEGYYECTNTDEYGTQCTETKTIPATGHSPEFTVSVPATCETDGYDLYLCSCVNASTLEKIIELAESVEDTTDGITAAKELAALLSDGTLEDGQYSKENIDNAFGHTCTVTETPATCTEAGEITYTCTICGSVFTDEIPALSDGDHTWDAGVVTKEATCKDNGEVLYTCTVCGATKTETTLADTENGHSYKITATTDATCKEKGSITYTCSICNEEYTEYTDTIDHNMVQVEIKAPTCTEYGYTLYQCSMCETTEERDIVEAYGHLWREDKDKSLAASCTTAGYTYNVCEYCKTVEEVPIPATGHSWVDGDVIEKATCSKEGTVKQVCSVCGEESTETGTLPKDPDAHTWDEGVVKEATCTTDGKITYTCTGCGTTTTEVIPATGHSYVDIVVAPTHDSDGYTIHICENCSSSGTIANLESLAEKLTGYVETSQSNAEATMEKIAAALAAEDANSYYTDTDKSALGHDYGKKASETEAATCDTAGYNRWACSCGDYFDVEIPATGDHTWDSGKESPAATHDSTGTMVYTCTVCGATKSTTIPKVGYSWGEWYTVKAATHLAEGQQRRDCNCGNSWCTASETKSIAKLTQHTYKAKVTAPTCTSAGYTTYTCECGDQYTDNIIEALGHNWDSGKVTKSATCNATGTKTYTCKSCGATKEESIAKTSHTYTTTKTSATCTKQGYTTYTCKTCGYSYKSNYTDAKGHNYEFTKYSVKATRNKNGQKLYTCTRCGKTKTTSFAKIKSWKLSSTSATYTGKNITPKITVKDANGNTISSQYYYYRIYCEKTQDVVGRINWVDKYYIEVVMKTKYSGEIMVGEFTVKPKSRSISSITKGSKCFTVKWKALKSSQVSGYQIQYSTSKNFTSKKTVTVKGNTKTSKKIKSLKGNKKYYVRIRTYKTRNGLKYYSSWSSVKGVTTKK